MTDSPVERVPLGWPQPWNELDWSQANMSSSKHAELPEGRQREEVKELVYNKAGEGNGVQAVP